MITEPVETSSGTAEGSGIDHGDRMAVGGGGVHGVSATAVGRHACGMANPEHVAILKRGVEEWNPDLLT